MYIHLCANVSVCVHVGVDVYAYTHGSELSTEHFLQLSSALVFERGSFAEESLLSQLLWLSGSVCGSVLLLSPSLQDAQPRCASHTLMSL